MLKTWDVWLSKCLLNGWNPLEMKCHKNPCVKRVIELKVLFPPPPFQGQAGLELFFIFIYIFCNLGDDLKKKSVHIRYDLLKE